MLLVFIICYYKFPDHRVVYKGNYSIQLKEKNYFLFHFSPNKSLCPRCSRLVLQPNNTRYFQFNAVELFGIYSSNYSSFFYYGNWGKNKNPKINIEMIYKAMEKLNLSEPYDQDRIQQEVFNMYSRSYPPMYSIAFNITEMNETISTFYSHTKANGKIYVNNNTKLEFDAIQFDELLYITEGKKFGLFSSLSIFLSFVAWRYLLYKFRSSVCLSQLSVHTFIMHVSFDFSFGIFLFNISDTNIHLTNLFNLLFLFIMILYIAFETRQLSDVWRVTIEDPDNVNLWHLYFSFFFEITAVVIIYTSALSYVFKHPYVWLTIMFSYLIPQIIHSAYSIGRKSNDTFFNIMVAIARLIPVFYFTCHRPNLMGTYSPYVAVFVTVYIFTQVFIIFLQNSFGSSFFLPNRYKPVAFDYARGIVAAGTECPICLCQIEGGDQTMVTPCQHSFHRECLQRWMEEQLICPVCRARLPPIEV